MGRDEAKGTQSDGEAGSRGRREATCNNGGQCSTTWVCGATFRAGSVASVRGTTTSVSASSAAGEYLLLFDERPLVN